MAIGEDGNTARRLKVSDDGSVMAEQYALKIVDVGDVSYLGEASIGSATSGALWRVRKLDQSSGLVITWADGNSDFDNIFDNYASLSYS